jgi:hypothetical protein
MDNIRLIRVCSKTNNLYNYYNRTDNYNGADYDHRTHNYNGADYDH